MAEGDTLLSFDPDLRRIRRIQDQAEERIVRLQPELAEKLLRQVYDDVEKAEGTFEWARQAFLMARVDAAKSYEEAEDGFNEAIRRIAKIPACDPQFRILVHECFAKYLSERRRFPAAQKQHDLAEQLAMANGPKEVLAQIYMRIIEVNFQIAKNPKQLKDLELFKNVAYRKPSTCEHQHRAWMKHEAVLQRTAADSQFMRSSMPLDAKYFENLLDSTSEKVHEKEDQDN